MDSPSCGMMMGMEGMKIKKLTSDNIETALEVVENLNPSNSTNLYGGLQTSNDIITNHKYLKNKNIFNIVLSDGEPNVNPPRGVFHEFEKIITATINGSDAGKMLSSDAVFKLATTHGFPFELVKEIANERGLSVDELKFAHDMKGHQDLSRSGSEP